MLKVIGNWTLDAGENDLHFGNMKNLNNSLSVFKCKGHGTRDFYIASNNQSVDTTGWGVGRLQMFIAQKFPNDPVPQDLFNDFYETLDSYQ